MKPRDYQQKYLNDIEQGEKNLVHLATGGGKSVIFLNYIKDCLKNNRPVLFIVYGNSILHQAVDKYFKDFDVSIMQGSRKWGMSNILACSIDTLTRKTSEQRARILDHYKDIVVDECHNATAEKYTRVLPPRNNKNFTVVGLTATPYAIGKKGHTYWTKYIKHTSVLELIKQKWLVPPRCYIAKVQMDTDVKKQAKDFNQKQLFEKNDEMKIYSSFIEEYKKHGKGKKCIFFGINVEHSKKTAKEYNEAGIKAAHADADTSMDERKRLIHEFEHGDLQILCNVNIFSTGVDTPIAAVGQFGRPTRSRVLWIQQVGRVLRPFINKNFAIVLDHGGNVNRCGHPVEDFEPVLKDNEKDKDPAIKLYTCNFCNFILGSKQMKCPSCGIDNQKVLEEKERKIKQEKEAKLQRIKFKQIQKEREARSKPWKNMAKWHFSTDLCAYLKRKWGTFPYEPLNMDHIVLPDNEEFKKITAIIDQAYKFKHKPNSVLFKVYDAYPNTEYLRFPEWFLKIKREQQIQKTSESNSRNTTTSSTDFSTRKVFR